MGGFGRDGWNETNRTFLLTLAESVVFYVKAACAYMTLKANPLVRVKVIFTVKNAVCNGFGHTYAAF